MSICVYGFTTRADQYRIRYIGQTRYLRRRFNDHVVNAIREKQSASRVRSWIRARVKAEEEILLIVLKEYAEWNTDERFFVKNFRERGFKLLNATEGGDSGRCAPCSLKHREALSRAMSGKRRSQLNPNHKSNISQGLKRYRKTASHQQAIIDWHVGSWWITDGDEERLITPVMPFPTGWQRGRLRLSLQRMLEAR